MPDVIQALWIGPRLSVMERLCISSFLRNGHPFHLYVYEPVEGVPPGVVLLDANLILPASRIFMYPGIPSYAGFANFFRYKLLLERGGWFVDADTICLKPFEFSEPYVFSSEGSGEFQIANVAAIKVPAGSAVARFASEACENMDVTTLRWGQSGPRLIMQAAEHYGLQQYIQAPEVFCPVHHSGWERLLDGEESLPEGSTTCAIHLWHELWRRSGRDKDRDYHPACPFEQLKKRYLGD